MGGNEMREDIVEWRFHPKRSSVRKDVEGLTVMLRKMKWRVKETQRKSKQAMCYQNRNLFIHEGRKRSPEDIAASVVCYL
ncbi:hypothetical protein U1Q18_013672 [Sarracenia purpurea var. burkii]